VQLCCLKHRCKTFVLEEQLFIFSTPSHLIFCFNKRAMLLTFVLHEKVVGHLGIKGTQKYYDSVFGCLTLKINEFGSRWLEWKSIAA